MWLRYAKRAVTGLLLAVALLAGALLLMWNDRADLGAIDLASPRFSSSADTDTVTATWLGVGTVLFDDGETQILIDGFFTRPSLADIVFSRPISNDIPNVNYVMNEFRMRRLAAIIPVHNHFDHAMDIGALANRSSASVLGTSSTAQIARGANVPEDQITVVSPGEPYSFGAFTVRLRPADHAPIGWNGSVPLDGTIDKPLTPPQPVSAWRFGGAHAIILEHPKGTALVQGSAAYRKYDLQDVVADVVFLGVSQLDSLGRDYAELYWQHTVTSTGGRSVYPLHFDDYTRPFGEVVLPPRFIDNFETTAAWLQAFRDRWDRDAEVFLPEFGRPMDIFPAEEPAPLEQEL